mgnify:CR=1 FL=1
MICLILIHNSIFSQLLGSSSSLSVSSEFLKFPTSQDLTPKTSIRLEYQEKNVLLTLSTSDSNYRLISFDSGGAFLFQQIGLTLVTQICQVFGDRVAGCESVTQYTPQKIIILSQHANLEKYAITLLIDSELIGDAKGRLWEGEQLTRSEEVSKDGIQFQGIIENETVIREKSNIFGNEREEKTSGIKNYLKVILAIASVIFIVVI